MYKLEPSHVVAMPHSYWKKLININSYLKYKISKNLTKQLKYVRMNCIPNLQIGSDLIIL